MDYGVFEARAMELLFKTNAKLTPQLASFRIGCPVDIARKYLEHMATSEILVMDVDSNGVIQYEMPGRPPPTNEPLSWGGAGHQVGIPNGYSPPPPGPVHQHGVSPVNIQIHNAPVPQAPQFVVLSNGSEKSVGTAVVLSLFFGPLGMLYSTGIGALVMFFANLVVVPMSLGAGLVITVPIGCFWAASAASEHNRKLRQPIQAYAPMAQQLPPASYYPPPPPPGLPPGR